MRIYKKTKGFNKKSSVHVGGEDHNKSAEDNYEFNEFNENTFDNLTTNMSPVLGYNNCVINADGGYYTVMDRFPIPSNIRLITTTLKGFMFWGRIQYFLTLLANDVEHFKNTDTGIAITKEGMLLQKQLRASLSRNNHYYKMMTRLVPVKQFERYRNILLRFCPEKEYYNSGFYVYFNGKWILYYPVRDGNTITLSKKTEDYKIINFRNNNKYYEITKPFLNIKDEVEIPLSECLTLLNEEAIRLKTNFNVYLNVCNEGELTNELREENRVLLNRRRDNTMNHNLILNETQRSGVTKNETRTLHFKKNFFNNGYFERSLSNLPKKDKKLLSNRFEINTEKDWEEIRTDTNFQISYKLIHSRFELGRKKYTQDMTPEELEAIAKLGLNNKWDPANSNVIANIFYTPFDKLSENQRAAAKTLGYTRKDFPNEHVGGGKNKKSCKIAKRKLTKKKKTPAAKKKKRVRKIHKGPRGGRYYITKGRKVYL